MPLHADDFMKISKALENSYQHLINDHSQKLDSMDQIKAAREEYLKAMLHATFQDDEILQITKG